MNLPLPELFLWESRPKMLCHHLRWQKFLQQRTIQQQRQGSPHTACCYWQFGSAAVVICQHTPQNPSPAPAVGAKFIPWWVQNTGTASPTPCARCFARAAPAPSAVAAARLPSLAPSSLEIPTEHLQPRYYRAAAGHREQSIYSRYPKHEQGSPPSWPLQAGAEEVSRFPSLPGRGSDHPELLAQGTWPEPQEQ